MAIDTDKLEAVAMKTNHLPDKTFLQACFDYNSDTGELFWKTRPEWTFNASEKWTCTQKASQWNTQFAGKPAFTADNGEGYRVGKINGKCFLAHRIIWKLLYGTEPKIIDHDNRNKSDNRKANLVNGSHSDNLKNMPPPRNNTSGVVGVSYHTRDRKWRAQISNQGRRIALGYFDTKEAAVAARLSSEKEYNYHPNHGRTV